MTYLTVVVVKCGCRSFWFCENISVYSVQNMEEKVLNGLEDLGYTGPLLVKENLDSALQDGAKSIEFTKLVSFLTNEIRTLLKSDEEVNAISEPEDSVAFVMEVSSFLKELNCPYAALTLGHISDRLQNIPDRLLLLDYLITQLMGARILQDKKPDKKIELKLQETDEAAQMRKILMNLRFPKPPANITVPQLFQKLTPTVQSTVQKAGQDLVGNPAFNGTLTDKQWEILNGVQKDLHSEYKIRREMLLTRLDVTIQSFQWSDRTKGKDEMFEKIYSEKRKRLKADPDVDLSAVIAARDEIAIIEKTSNSTVRKNTRSELNKVIIGQVPDRGGRTSEQAPPPPEMPSWQQRAPGPSGGGRGGRGGGNFSRGDFHNKQQQNYSRGNYDNSGGSYSKNQASYDTSANQGRNFDSAGSYGSSSYSNRGGAASYENTGASYGGDSRSYGSSGGGTSSYGRGSSSYGNSSNYEGSRNFDSAGSYGKDNRNQYEQDSKRVKTYDTFQSNRTTYTDQYVQEEQHNRQYHGRGRGGHHNDRARGRSNYNRGGRNNY